MLEMSLLPSITNINPNQALFAPYTSSGSNLPPNANVSSISTVGLDVRGGNIGLGSSQYISTIGGQLFYYNGSLLEPISAISSISSIEGWSEYPAISSINAAGENIINANIISGNSISTLASYASTASAENFVGLEMNISSIVAGDITCRNLTAVSTIVNYEFISAAVVVTDDVYATTLSTNALIADYADIAGAATVGQQVNVGNFVGPYFEANVVPKAVILSEINYSGIVPIPGPHYDTATLELEMSSLLVEVANDQIVKGSMRIGPLGIDFIDNSTTTALLLSSGNVLANTIVASNSVSTGALFAPTWNGYTPGDFLSTITPDINISSITSASLSVSTNLLNISSAVVNCGVSTFNVSGNQNVNNTLTTTTLVAGNAGVIGTLGANSIVTNALTGKGPNFFSNATTIDGISSDIVIQSGPLGAQGFRVSPLGVTTTASGYATTTTGVYQSYTAGQYIDLLAGGTLTLSHGSAFGDNAVVVKNFAGNANARMWFKNGGDISSLTTLNTQDINATGTILGASGAIQSFGVNTITALTGGTLPILNVPNTANISTLNVSSVMVNTIDALNISTGNATITQDTYTNYLFNNNLYPSTINMTPNGNIVGNTSTFLTNFSLLDTEKLQADIVDTNLTSSVAIEVSSINANPVPFIQYGFSTLQAAEYVIELPKFYGNTDWVVVATPQQSLNNSIHASTLSISSFSIHGQPAGAGVPFNWLTVGNTY